MNKIGSIDQLDFKKLLLIEQNIKINPKNLNEIFSFLTLHKKGKIELTRYLQKLEMPKNYLEINYNDT